MRIACNHEKIGQLDDPLLAGEASLQDRAVLEIFAFRGILTCWIEREVAAFFAIQESTENGWRVERRQAKPVIPPCGLMSAAVSQLPIRA